MKAILSDIHGNLEALEAVLEDAVRHRVDGFCCLGDVVGYGPNPRECLDLILDWELVLLGNHENANFVDTDGWSHLATQAMLFSQRVIDLPVPTSRCPARRRAFLEGLPRSVQQGAFLFVHGSPRSPTNEYIFPEDIGNGRKMTANFAAVERFCFMGHTHLIGIFTGGGKFFAPGDFDDVHRLGSGKMLVNVGSVGQPRDGDPRACYVLFNGEVVRFRRVEYDVEKTVQKIREIEDLDNFFGERLVDGR